MNAKQAQVLLLTVFLCDEPYRKFNTILFYSDDCNVLLTLCIIPFILFNIILFCLCAQRNFALLHASFYVA